MSKKSSPTKNSIRVQNWRKRLSAAGGRIIQVHLQKEDVELFDSLRERRSDKRIEALIGDALKALKDKPESDGKAPEIHSSASDERTDVAPSSPESEGESWLDRIKREAPWGTL
jgi:hypothetical protein